MEVYCLIVPSLAIALVASLFFYEHPPEKGEETPLLLRPLL